jgi:hypothetical protein
VALLGGTGVANAASASGTPGNAAQATAVAGASRTLSPSGSYPGDGSGGPMQGTSPAGGLPGGSPDAVMPGGWIMPVHGQVVVTKPGGGYQRVDFQSGSVTKVSTGSITVKSPDGFTQSYTITDSTIVSAGSAGITSVKAGNKAVLIATVSDHSTTATRIIDVTMIKNSHQQFGFGPTSHP